MLRERLQKALKEATLAKDTCATATVRLILAALKDRDIAARSKDGSSEISDDEILRLLQTMVKQRRESIDMYVKGGRQDLADREADEIDVIRRFLPEQMGDAAIAQAVASATQDDLVVIAGKGHETYQEIAGRRLPFGDRVLARELSGGTV